MALMKCVVPSMTAEMLSWEMGAGAAAPRIAATTPVFTSGVVGVLKAL